MCTNTVFKIVPGKKIHSSEQIMVNLTSSSFPFLFLFAICGILDLASLWHPRDKTVTHTHTHNTHTHRKYCLQDMQQVLNIMQTEQLLAQPSCAHQQVWTLQTKTTFRFTHVSTLTNKYIICNINTFTYRLWHIAFVIGPVSANTERDKTKHSLPHTRSTSTHLDTCAHGTCQGWITWVMRKL